MDVTAKLEILIRARVPIIVVQSHEEARVEALIKQIAFAQKNELHTWAVTTGLPQTHPAPAEGYKADPTTQGTEAWSAPTRKGEVYAASVFDAGGFCFPAIQISKNAPVFLFYVVTNLSSVRGRLTSLPLPYIIGGVFQLMDEFSCGEVKREDETFISDFGGSLVMGGVSGLRRA